MDTKQKWDKNISHEIEFWRQWVTNAEYLQARIAPVRYLPDTIRSKIPAKGGEAVRLLEVGSGPMTILGNYWEGRTVEVHAVDPLADKYNLILQEKGINPPTKTVQCAGEELTTIFPENHFDYAMAYNCLDHSYDPIRCIEQMITVVKKGCTISLTHYRNEGETEHYVGLHQWNFDVINQIFFINNVATSYNVHGILEGRIRRITSTIENGLVCVEIVK